MRGVRSGGWWGKVGKVGGGGWVWWLGEGGKGGGKDVGNPKMLETDC